MRNGFPGCGEVKKNFHLNVSHCATECIKTYLLPPPVRLRNLLCRHFDAVSERWSNRAIQTLSYTIQRSLHMRNLQGSFKTLSMVLEGHYLAIWTHASRQTMSHAPASRPSFNDFSAHTYTEAHGDVRYIGKIEDLCAVGE